MADNDRQININECQFKNLKTISTGNAEFPHLSLLKIMKLFIRRQLTSSQDRAVHNYANKIIDSFCNFNKNTDSQVYIESDFQKNFLKENDLVRVKSKDEIEATLNHLGQLKGCTFMREMIPYCGTVQRVLKPMERFVDERELRVKKCKGLVLLKDVMCQGTANFGRCDRSCILFWRQEWLQKIE